MSQIYVTYIKSLYKESLYAGYVQSSSGLFLNFNNMSNAENDLFIYYTDTISLGTQEIVDDTDTSRIPKKYLEFIKTFPEAGRYVEINGEIKLKQ